MVSSLRNYDLYHPLSKASCRDFLLKGRYRLIAVVHIYTGKRYYQVAMLLAREDATGCYAALRSVTLHRQCSRICVGHQTMSIDNVFKLFGEASCWASILEEQLCNICMLNERVVNQQKYNPENAKQIVNKFSRLTTGQLLAEIKKTIGKDLESKVDSIFKPALEKRNLLIHDFFIEYRDILTDSRRIPLAIGELNEINAAIFSAADFATKTCNTLTEYYLSGDNNAAQPIIPPDAAR